MLSHKQRVQECLPTRLTNWKCWNAKDQEKRNALTTLSDYWNTDSKQDNENEIPEEDESYGFGGGKNPGKSGNPALSSYRFNMQSTLGSFYQNARKFRNNGAPQTVGRDERKTG